MCKSPEDYLMCLGEFAYDPYIKDGGMYVRVAHRGTSDYYAVVQAIHRTEGYYYELVENTMPMECVKDFAVVLRRNLHLLKECCGWKG